MSENNNTDLILNEGEERNYPIEYGEVRSHLTYAEAIKLGEEFGLNPKQVSFVIHYISMDSFGHGVDAYCAAYGLNKNVQANYHTANANSNKLLKDMRVMNYLNAIMESLYLNDAYVDQQLSYVLTQNADLSAKMSAVKEYNKLKNRIDNVLNINVAPKLDYSKLSNEELEQLLSLQEKAKK